MIIYLWSLKLNSKTYSINTDQNIFYSLLLAPSAVTLAFLECDLFPRPHLSHAPISGHD